MQYCSKEDFAMNIAAPELGFINVVRICIKVVLQEPFGPSRLKTSLSLISRLTLFTAAKFSNFSVSFFMIIKYCSSL